MNSPCSLSKRLSYINKYKHSDTKNHVCQLLSYSILCFFNVIRLISAHITIKTYRRKKQNSVESNKMFSYPLFIALKSFSVSLGIQTLTFHQTHFFKESQHSVISIWGIFPGGPNQIHLWTVYLSIPSSLILCLPHVAKKQYSNCNCGWCLICNLVSDLAWQEC